MPENEVVDEATVCDQDVGADLQMGELNDMYYDACKEYISSISTSDSASLAPGPPVMRPRGRAPKDANGMAKVWNETVGCWEAAPP